MVVAEDRRQMTEDTEKKRRAEVGSDLIATSARRSRELFPGRCLPPVGACAPAESRKKELVARAW